MKNLIIILPIVFAVLLVDVFTIVEKVNAQQYGTAGRFIALATILLGVTCVFVITTLKNRKL